MNTFKFEMSREMAAPPEAVYAVIADYRVGHPAILPKQYTLHVESGGTGAGTVFRLDARVMGTKGSFRSIVSEPEPGRVLVESAIGKGPVTTFIVDPVEGGRSRVTFSTVMPVRGGILGRVERWLTERLMHRMYSEELGNLAEYAAAQAATRKGGETRGRLPSQS